jgi:hypothetical protein
MSEEKLAYSKANCPCANTGKFPVVAQAAAVLYGNLVRDANICFAAADEVLEYSFLAIITAHTQAGTAIKPGSQEAQWEMNRVLTGLEARLKARYQHALEVLNKLTPEERAAWERGEDHLSKLVNNLPKVES